MTKKMIFPLVGGIGNQLFVVTAGIFFRVKERARVTFTHPLRLRDQREHKVSTDVTQTRFFLSQDVSVTSNWDEGLVTLARVDKFLANASFGSRPRGAMYFQEMNVKNWKEEVNKGLKLVNFGYYQTKFFLNELRDGGHLGDIELNSEPPTSKILDVCGIHVRRGDYLLRQNNNLIGALDNAYFENAALRMRKDRGLNNIAIFSDYPEKSLVHRLSDRGFDVDVKSTSDPELDLWNLSRFENLILSNSSFSWWAANLCQAEYVIAPSPWFKVMHFGDLYQSHWCIEKSIWT